MINWEIKEYGLVSSTNDILRAEAENHARPGLVIMAEAQKEGRGRHGRNWVSEPGNLYASLLLPVFKPEMAASKGFLVGVALCRAVGGTRLKWPNDLLLQRKKCGGLLLESVPSRPDVVIAGLGVNISSSPENVMYPAGRVTGVKPRELLDDICRHLSDIYVEFCDNGFEVVRREWLKNAEFVGETITIRLPDGEKSGIFKGIDANGNLILDGQVVMIGDVFG